MKIRNKYYPYPVLTTYSDDYMGSKFDVESSFSLDGYDVKLDFTIDLQNDYLAELLKNETVAIVYHIECSRSRFRKAYETFSLKHSLKIPISKLKDKVDICSFIIAKKDISNYTNTSFNPDYGTDFSFDIERGCVLAVASPFELNIPKIREELKDRPSFIVIVQNPKEDASQLDVNLDNRDKMRIYLPVDTYKIYKQMANNEAIKKILVSSIVIPSLVYTLEYLKSLANDSESGGNFTSMLDFEWMRAFETVLKNKPFEITDFTEWLKDCNSLEWAQKLLESPIVGCVKQLYDMEGVDDEN